jgi:rod shape-determining protein MreD
MASTYTFFWLFPISFFFAFVLTVLPLPLAVSAWRPEWSALLLVFWTIHSRERVGIVVAWCLGVFMDVLEGTTFGVNAIAFAVVSYLILSMHQRIKMFPLMQQSVIVFMLIGINLMVVHLINNLTAFPVTGFSYLKPALTSALLWPFIYSVMQRMLLKF